MGYLPKDARWFIAELVIKIEVEGEPRNVVHVNSVLVNADSAEHAYERAIELGVAYESTDENEAGKAIQTSFVGLSDLYVMYDEPAHGAEIFYEERIGVEQEELKTLVRNKAVLTVFTPWEPPLADKPDYAIGRIVRDMREDLKSKS
ncbi:MAG: DUF4288 domain-containing protein [Betaproteobacteria bacterium]|nr:DUF4288 domain-containing protein [Betaproteobacteria bacterium]